MGDRQSPTDDQAAATFPISSSQQPCRLRRLCCCCGCCCLLLHPPLFSMATPLNQTLETKMSFQKQQVSPHPQKGLRCTVAPLSRSLRFRQSLNHHLKPVLIAEDGHSTHRTTPARDVLGQAEDGQGPQAKGLFRAFPIAGQTDFLFWSTAKIPQWFAPKRPNFAVRTPRRPWKSTMGWLFSAVFEFKKQLNIKYRYPVRSNYFSEP